MKILEDLKLDFDDVLITPKPSELTSRSEVNLNVAYVCKHSKKMFYGCPIILANMDTVGQIPVAKEAAKENVWTALHKFYDEEALVKFAFNEQDIYKNCFISCGISKEEFQRIKGLSQLIHIHSICIDAANAYTYSFLDCIKRIRDLLPDTIIMAGNVCTPEGVENIIKAGADIAKSGIANGCFIKGTAVITDNGKKSIEKIKIGDNVLTHTGTLKKVTATHQKTEKERIFDINGIKCTKNHKFYVVDKKYKDIINEDNIHNYAKWVCAEDLSEGMFLVKMQN